MSDRPAASPPGRGVLVTRVLGPFQRFAAAGALGGIVLLACTLVALAAANSPWRDAWNALWRTTIHLGPAGHPLALSLRDWINDALMAVFFLLVGLEMKRELLVGELASPRQAMLPIVAAVGGMLLPALFYVTFNAGGDGAHGWGVPMATDIAFALGVLALLGPRVPLGLKVFLVALAIVDDVGAVLVIAGFYTAEIHPQALAVAAAIVVALVVVNRLRVHALAPYVVLGLALWLAVHESGIHATLAGVILALAIPARTRIDAEDFAARSAELLDAFRAGETGDRRVLTSHAQQEALNTLALQTAAVTPPLLRLEHALHGPVSYTVMPLFALANAGVELTSFGDALANPIAWGIAAGLLVGKTVGITLFAWLAVRSGIATLPEGVTWRALYAASWLGAIGFTMALFVAGLAFAGTPALDPAKAAILAASAVAGTTGFLLLRASTS